MICIICGHETKNITLCCLTECKKHCVECHKVGSCDYFETAKEKRVERDKQVLALHGDHKTYLEIALALGVSISTVNDTLYRYKIIRPRAVIILKTAERNAEIRRLAGSMLQKEIAAKYNLSSMRVSQIIKAQR
jgi:DNA-binding CsgD family transcriptional regulator